jgi:hypothetical protein
MTRWTPPPFGGLLPQACSMLALLGGLALPGAVAPVLAQTSPQATRSFPPQAKRALMDVRNTQEVLLNGVPTRLSPGSRIRSVGNTLVTSGTLVGQKVLVNYTTDTLGQPHDIWILTDAEAAQKRPGSEDVVFTNIVGGESKK